MKNNSFNCDPQTIGISANRQGRRFIGLEKNSEYDKIARSAIVMKNNVQYLYWETQNAGTDAEYEKYYCKLYSGETHEITGGLYDVLRVSFKPYEIESDDSGATYARSEADAARANEARAIVDTQDAFLAMTGRI
jgi:hypothetical protein